MDFYDVYICILYPASTQIIIHASCIQLFFILLCNVKLNTS